MLLGDDDKIGALGEVSAGVVGVDIGLSLLLPEGDGIGSVGAGVAGFNCGSFDDVQTISSAAPAARIVWAGATTIGGRT